MDIQLLNRPHIWHQAFTINTISFIENPTGCGTYFMKGFVDSTYDKLLPIFEYFKKNLEVGKFLISADDYSKLAKAAMYDTYNLTDVSVIFATISSGNDHCKEMLKKLGFKKVKTYTNLRHGSDKQSLYYIDFRKKQKIK